MSCFRVSQPQTTNQEARKQLQKSAIHAFLQLLSRFLTNLSHQTDYSLNYDEFNNPHSVVDHDVPPVFHVGSLVRPNE
jgi:hypothetical protein